MKKIILASVITLVVGTAFTLTETVFTQSGIAEKDIQNQLVNIALYGRETNTPTVFDFYKVENSNIVMIRTFLRNGLDKTETANELVKYVKQYYKSDAFKQAFNSELAKQKPIPFFADTIKLWKQYQADLQGLETAYKVGKKSATKESVQKSYQSTSNSTTKGLDAAMQILANNPQLAAQSGMSAAQIQQMLKQAKEANEQAKVSTQEAIENEFGGEAGVQKQKEIDKSYEHDKELLLKSYQEQAKALTSYLLHADAIANIKAALSNSISMINTVDFDATLNGRQFANKEYEAKDNRWKMIYRAGRTNAVIAKTAATQWISELK